MLEDMNTSPGFKKTAAIIAILVLAVLLSSCDQAQQVTSTTDTVDRTPAPGAVVSPTPKPGLAEALSQVLRQLPEGRMVFNPPEEMKAGTWERIELRIQQLMPEVSEDELQVTLTAGMSGQGEPQVEQIKVGTVMRARLTGEGFAVSHLDEEEQIVSGDTFTQWAWDVKPEKSGELDLNLNVTVKVFAEGIGERSRDLPVVTKTVMVRVNPVYSLQSFVGKYWQWMFTTLLIPLGGWIWKAYSAKKAPKPKSLDDGKKEDKGKSPKLFE